MSVEAMAVVLHHSSAAGTDKLVLLGIANHEGDGGAFPAVATLAKYANVSSRSVQHSLAKLVKGGELGVDYRRGGRPEDDARYRTNRYTVLVRCPVDCDGSTNHRSRGEASVTAQSDPGVKPSASRGEVQRDPGVKPTSPKPSIEPPVNHPVGEKQAPRPSKRRSSFPLDWTPNETERAAALAVGMDATTRRAEFQRFKDHHLAKGSTMADWSAAWRTWCHNWRSFGGKPAVADDHASRVLAGYA